MRAVRADGNGVQHGCHGQRAGVAPVLRRRPRRPPPSIRRRSPTRSSPAATGRARSRPIGSATATWWCSRSPAWSSTSNPATGAQTQILDIRSKVNSQGEAGALDIVTDPAGTGFYLYYTVANSDRMRISHFTAGSSTEQIIWTNPGLGYNVVQPVPRGRVAQHRAGRQAVRLDRRPRRGPLAGPHERLRQDPADQPRRHRSRPTTRSATGRARTSTRSGRTASATPSAPRSTARRASTGSGDVGGNVDTQAYEEVDIGQAGANYGWPSCEGPLGQPKNGPTCPAGVMAPVFSYAHTTGTGCCQNKAIVGGEVYRGVDVPAGGLLPLRRLPDEPVLLAAARRRRPHRRRERSACTRHRPRRPCGSVSDRMAPSTG